MNSESVPHRYVIAPVGVATPTRPQRPKRGPLPAPAQRGKPLTPATSPQPLATATVLLATALVSCLLVIGFGLHYLSESWNSAGAATRRANSAQIALNTLNLRLEQLSSTRGELIDEQRKLLTHFRDAQEEATMSRQSANLLQAAHQQAVQETQAVAKQWSQHLSQVEQSMLSTVNELSEAKEVLSKERQANAESAEALNAKLKAVDDEATGYYNLARSLDKERASAQSDLSQAEATIRCLKSENSSLASRVSCLESEVSCLKSQLSAAEREASQARSSHRH